MLIVSAALAGVRTCSGRNPSAMSRASAQRWKARHELKERRHFGAGACAQNGVDQPIMEERLQTLSRAGRKHAPFLKPPHMVGLHHPRLERLPENVRRCHRVLDGKINAHAAQGRHGMRRVANAKQTWAVPTIEPVEDNGEKLDLLPVLELVEPIRELGHKSSKALTECRQSVSANFVR